MIKISGMFLKEDRCLHRYEFHLAKAEPSGQKKSISFYYSDNKLSFAPLYTLLVHFLYMQRSYFDLWHNVLETTFAMYNKILT